MALGVNKVAINTCSYEQMQTLPGFSPITADRIMTLRECMTIDLETLCVLPWLKVTPDLIDLIDFGPACTPSPREIERANSLIERQSNMALPLLEQPENQGPGSGHKGTIDRSFPVQGTSTPAGTQFLSTDQVQYKTSVDSHDVSDNFEPNQHVQQGQQPFDMHQQIKSEPDNYQEQLAVQHQHVNQHVEPSTYTFNNQPQGDYNTKLMISNPDLGRYHDNNHQQGVSSVGYTINNPQQHPCNLPNMTQHRQQVNFAQTNLQQGQQVDNCQQPLYSRYWCYL